MTTARHQDGLQNRRRPVTKSLARQCNSRARHGSPHTATCLRSREAAREILLEIVHFLEADRDAQQPIPDPRRLALLRGQATMRGGRGVGDGRLGITEVCRNRDQARGIDDAPRGLAPAVELKGEQSAEALLLARRQRVLRVAVETGVINPAYR